MIQFISEFKLPKEFSKKKKFDLLIGKVITEEIWKDISKEVDWDINLDKTKVFLTIENCAKYAIESALNDNMDENLIKSGYVVICAFTYSSTILNEIPLCRDTHNNPIDCEWNMEDTSFNFTFRDNKWEDLGISTLKIDAFNYIKDDESNLYKITNFNVYPVVDMTKI